MIEKAVAFAKKAHSGAVRKGTNVPYIVHPLEAAVIVSLITTDRELIEAALLHDVIEDAGVSAGEIEELFGPRVALLVLSESEDKTKSWKERKQATIDRLKNAPYDVKVLTLGDKLSNMRSTAKDYMLMGDELWERFNEKRKEMQGWYYLGIADALSDLEDIIYYREYVALCKKVFEISI